MLGGVKVPSSIQEAGGGPAGRRRADQLPGGRHGLSREAVAESQRERLLAAMARVVGRRGYQDAHVTEVVDRAGVSRRSFYEHFDGKQDCFGGAYAREMERLAGAAVAAFEAESEWVDGLRAGLGALLDALAAQPEIARACFVEIFGAGPSAGARREQAMRGFLALFESAPTNVPREMRIFESLGMGRVADLGDVLHREISAGRAKQLPELLPELTYLMAVPFVGPEAAKHELERARAKEAA